MLTFPTVMKPSPVAIHTQFTQSVIANMLGDTSESRSFAVYGKLFQRISDQQRSAGLCEFMVGLSDRFGLLKLLISLGSRQWLLLSAIFDHENLNVSNLP